MDQTSESLLTIQRTIQEIIAGVKAIRIVLYNQGITTPSELVKLQQEVREGMSTVPTLDYLLKQLSDLH